MLKLMHEDCLHKSPPLSVARYSFILSCINEYLAIDSGGYVYEQSSRINCSIWLDASQRSQGGVWVNRSVREVKCKGLWTVMRTRYCAISEFTFIYLSRTIQFNSASNRLLKISHVSAKIVGLPTPMLSERIDHAILTKAHTVTTESDHPLSTFFHVLLSQSKHRCIKCKISRYSRSFVPVAIRMLNAKWFILLSTGWTVLIVDTFGSHLHFVVTIPYILDVIISCTMHILFKENKVKLFTEPVYPVFCP